MTVSSSFSSTSEGLQKQQRQMSKQDFLDAASKGDLVNVKCCVNYGVSTESKNNDGWTALHFASYNAHLEIVKYLIETCHVDTEARDNDGWTALHFASDHGHLEIVKYLTAACNVDKEARDNDGWTVLHRACSNGHSEIVKYLIETCHVDMNVKNWYDETAYDLAQTNSKHEIVQYLKAVQDKRSAALSESMHSDEDEKRNNERAFLEAAKVGNLCKLKEFITKGIDKEAKNNQGYTALHLTSENGHHVATKYLIEECLVDKEAKSNVGYTALHRASINSRLEIVKYLLGTCQCDAESKNNDGCNALHFACIQNHLAIVTYLLEECRVDKEANTKNGWTALHCASEKGHMVIVKYLIEVSRVKMEAMTNDGQTAYDLSRIHNMRNVREYFEARSNETSSGVISDNKRKWSPENIVADEVCHFVVVTSSLCLYLIIVFNFSIEPPGQDKQYLCFSATRSRRTTTLHYKFYLFFVPTSK